jgi:hypothetical protein
MQILIFKLVDKLELATICFNKLVVTDSFVVLHCNKIVLIADGNSSAVTLHHYVTFFAVAWVILLIVFHVKEGELFIG